ncbi:MAG TPA: molybdenum cofactor biosynthesis protein MoaE [Acidobacteriota bacterium]|nr:molybdenum cofactor biosynthesis protein MoaE [Acidobacteriota bacterium]
MVALVTEEIRPRELIQQIKVPEAGALVTFDGIVRNHARGRRVRYLEYEAYGSMAEREMEKIRTEALSRWPLTGLLIVHRVGRLEIGESSVFIAVSAAHRGDAFDACRYTIDTLKQTVPIWKKEHYDDGEVWIEGYGA